jgi:hypothetical protein
VLDVMLDLLGALALFGQATLFILNGAIEERAIRPDA